MVSPFHVITSFYYWHIYWWKIWRKISMKLMYCPLNKHFLANMQGFKVNLENTF